MDDMHLSVHKIVIQLILIVFVELNFVSNHLKT